MYTLTKLQKLCDVPTVSGFETAAYDVISKICPEGIEIYTDKLGSVHAIRHCGLESAPTILLDAHIDEIGMIVTSILDGGFLKVANIGGLDTRLLCASEVTIYGKNRTIAGIVCSTPPHLADKGDDKLPKVEDIAIDTGLTKEELNEIQVIGYPARFKVSLTQLQNNQVAGQGFDNKACVTVILGVLDRLQGKNLSHDIHCLFSVQEETGLAGAKTGSYGINAEFAIVMDVNFALQPECDEKKCIKLGGGAGFSLSSSTSISLTRDMIAYAQRTSAPHNIVVEATSTGTNATAIQVSREGIPCVVVSVPLKNMHTPSEVISLSDLDCISDLIAGYIQDQEDK